MSFEMNTRIIGDATAEFYRDTMSTVFSGGAFGPVTWSALPAEMREEWIALYQNTIAAVRHVEAHYEAWVAERAMAERAKKEAANG